MRHHPQLLEWTRIVRRHLPHLSRAQARGLATWSFGMVWTRSSSLTQIATFIAQLNGEKPNTVRNRLREWYQNAAAKSGTQRTELNVRSCFAPLLQWVLSLLPSGTTTLALALDATSLGQKFTILTISVLYRSCAIPVGWKVLPGCVKGAWKPEWQSLLAAFDGVVPPTWTVIVCADRGLYGDWLYEHIVSLGWHPLLRLNHQGTFRTPGQKVWQPLTNVVPQPGTNWAGVVQCFKTNPIHCTLLARWAHGYTAPWLIATDLSPHQADCLWYGLRCWIECSYRDIKSDGWQWQKTRLTDPQRAERHWLAMAIATIWLLSVGSSSDADPPAPNTTEMPDHHQANSVASPSKRLRGMSCFLMGLLKILADLLNGQPIRMPSLLPQPWPGHPTPLGLNTS